MIDVLVVVMAVVVVALVVGSRRMKSGRKRAGRDELLAVLAPIVGGSVSSEQVLTGRYRAYDVEASLHTTVPTAPNTPGSSQVGISVETVRVRLPGVQGAQPWSVWRAPTFPGWRWHFARGSDSPPFAGALSRLGGLPQPDPGLPDRLRAAGMLEAFEHLGPPTNDSLPHIQFRPDLRLQALERFRALGREIPASALKESPETGACLEVLVERTNEREPTPDGFRALLDAVIAIAEINARANPATQAR